MEQNIEEMINQEYKGGRTSFIILISIQLFEDVVRMWNSGGANAR